MDQRSDFPWAAPDGDDLICSLRALQIFSDGGVCDKGTCAAAYVIYVWVAQNGSLIRKTLFIKGIYVSSHLTPFGAEVLALRTALKDYLDLVGTCV